MLARLQQCVVITVGLVAATWVAVLLGMERPGVSLAGALVLLFGHSAVLAVEFVLMSRANRADEAPLATAAQVFRAWLSESVTAPAVFCWRQPFRSQSVPDSIGSDRRRGVLFVHGFVCNRGLWNPWLARLRAQDVPFIAVNLEPVFGSIDAYSPIIEKAVRQLAEETGQPPLVVAHSMGGLALRAWLRSYSADERVRHIITIGTPHRGTLLGAFGRSANTRQMRLGSDWLQQLESQEPAGRAARFTCFYSHCDNIVFPASCATLPGADNRHIAGCAHVEMALHEDVFDELQRRLAEAQHS